MEQPTSAVEPRRGDRRIVARKPASFKVHRVATPGDQAGAVRTGFAGRWIGAWLGATTLGVANAAVRQLAYADRVGELAAHQISTVMLLEALTYCIWLLDQRWPVPITRTAIAIGGSWAVLTVLFEFGLGGYSSWSGLFANYNLAAGRIWVLVPVWMALEPAVLQRLRAIRS